MDLPSAFVANISGVYQERGKRWLADLPLFLQQLSDEWSLSIHQPFDKLTYNYVAPVTLPDAMPAVLKAGVPNPEGMSEIAALAYYGGKGAVRVLKADIERGVFLMEQIKPGTVLTERATEERDGEATHVVASVMKNLWRPIPGDHPFPTLEKWTSGIPKIRPHFGGGTGPFPGPLLSEAEALYRELLASQPEPVLLHGDLHHDNILAATREPWLAIDPKGVVGDPAYDVGSPLLNLWQDRHTITDPQLLLQRRAYQYAEELNVERERIRAWGVCQAVLSAWWCIEDNGDCWQSGIEIAEVIRSIKL